MSYEIHDDREWRVSKSGFSIRTGWADAKKMIAKFPGADPGPHFDAKQFQEWLDNAQRICDLHNATLRAPTAGEGGGDG